MKSLFFNWKCFCTWEARIVFEFQNWNFQEVDNSWYKWWGSLILSVLWHFRQYGIIQLFSFSRLPNISREGSMQGRNVQICFSLGPQNVTVWIICLFKESPWVLPYSWTSSFNRSLACFLKLMIEQHESNQHPPPHSSLLNGSQILKSFLFIFLCELRIDAFYVNIWFHIWNVADLKPS